MSYKGAVTLKSSETFSPLAFTASPASSLPVLSRLHFIHSHLCIGAWSREKMEPQCTSPNHMILWCILLLNVKILAISEGDCHLAQLSLERLHTAIMENVTLTHSLTLGRAWAILCKNGRKDWRRQGGPQQPNHKPGSLPGSDLGPLNIHYSCVPWSPLVFKTVVTRAVSECVAYLCGLFPMLGYLISLKGRGKA